MSRSLMPEDIGKQLLVKTTECELAETKVKEFSPSLRYVYLDGYMLGGWIEVAHVEVLEELPPRRTVPGQ